MDTVRLRQLLSHQQNILSKIALGTPLNDILHDICLSIEDIMEGDSAKCSILSLKGDQLFHCAAPNIDADYCQQINGVKIGENTGSCGTAAYQKSRIIVEDITNSALWTDFKDLALAFKLRACWSTPIASSQSTILGTLAIYHDEPKAPSSKDLELIDYFVHCASIALEKGVESLKAEQLLIDLQHSNEKFKAFTKVMPDLALVLTEKGDYTDIYGLSDELLYNKLNLLINRNISQVLPEKDSKPIMAVIEKTLATNEVQSFEYELEVQNGKVMFEGRTATIDHYQPNDLSKRHVIWMARDVTAKRKAEKEIEKLAFFDPLTSLPNRRMLNERLTMCLERIKRSHKTGALLFLDLDKFKRINDSLGHSAGDKLLIDLSERLNAVIRTSDTLARVGGDEFILLLEYVGEDNTQAHLESERVAQKIHDVFNDKFEVEGLEFQVSCSIGICLIEDDNPVAENILKYADTAMYRSKMKGGNTYSFYDPKLQTLLENHIELETDIIRAIAANEFCTYFQPKTCVLGCVVGAEALIRWNHPTKGVITPSAFIAIAEQYGLIQTLQNIVLRDACLLIEQLTASNTIDDTFSISINISQCQLNSATLKAELLTILKGFSLPTSRIKLEVTESMLSSDIDSAIPQMQALKESGFILSIDDFGKGYSYLTHLNTFPVKELKIDKSFIDNILDEENGKSIVKAIINLAKSLNISVVAEGVESLAQFEALKAMCVDLIQGYVIAKPMIKDDYIHWHKHNLLQADVVTSSVSLTL